MLRTLLAAVVLLLVVLSYYAASEQSKAPALGVEEDSRTVPVSVAASPGSASAQSARHPLASENSTPSATVEKTPAKQEQESEKYGEVGGAVLDKDGNRMPYQRIGFVRPEGLKDLVMAAKHRLYSDKDGYFLAKRIPVGKHLVLFYGKQRGDVFRIVGSLEVREGHNAYDVIVFGKRTVSGVFTLVMPEGSVPPGACVQLELEVRASGSDEIVSVGTAVTAGPSKAGSSRGPKDPPARGAFSIGGLEPGAYTLRILFGAGKQAYFERDFDLFEGDVVLPSEQFTLQMFAEEGYRRSQL